MVTIGQPVQSFQKRESVMVRSNLDMARWAGPAKSFYSAREPFATHIDDLVAYLQLDPLNTKMAKNLKRNWIFLNSCLVSLELPKASNVVHVMKI